MKRKPNNADHTGFILGLVGKAFRVDFVPLYLQTQPKLTMRQAKRVLHGAKRAYRGS